MDVRIELTRNKHAYAQRKDGEVLLRIPHRLSATERERVIQLLLGKVESKKATGQTTSLFLEYYKSSTVMFWSGEQRVFSVKRKRIQYILVEQLEADNIPLADALAEKLLTKSQAKTLLLHYCRIHQTDAVAAVIEHYVNMLQVKHRLKTVLLTEAKTKWGSAHGDGTIRISLKTLLLPDHLFRYVCAHEAAHLVHMNHGSGFWNTLERICPNSKAMRKELHSYGY